MVLLEIFKNTRNFNYARTVGGGLSASGDLGVAGAGKVITLRPMPHGLQVSRSCYISGGTGTAETAAITAVSGTGGDPSGTITVTTANSHTGTWSVQSATAGFQEAIDSFSGDNGGMIVPAVGLSALYDKVVVDVGGTKILGHGRNATIQRDSGVLFDVTAGNVEIGYLAMTGGGSSGDPAPSGNIAIQTDESRGHFHDLSFNYLYGGILNTGGFHTEMSSIWARNMAGYIVKHTGGVSPFIRQITYDTDDPNDVPSEAGIIINASAYVQSCDILHCKYGIRVEPVDARLEWCFIRDCVFDQSYSIGVYVINNSIHALEGVYITNSWSNTAGVNGTLAGVAPTEGVGFQVEGSGSIDEVIWWGGQIFNNNDHNVKILAGNRVEIRGGTRILGGNLDDKADIDQVYVAAVEYVLIEGAQFHPRLGSGAFRSAILAAPTTGELVVRNCHFEGSYASLSPVHNLATTPENVRVDGFNVGMDDVAQEVASAAILSLPSRQYFEITGTTNVTEVHPAYQGRHVVLSKTDVGSFDIVVGGNIQTGVTMTQGVTAIGDYVGSGWIFRI